jgi:CRISPR-associated protein Csb2
MLVIEISFPGGRYHATPWDKHVNEGAVEWPPSPWRFLRALISTWYTKGDDARVETLRSLVDKLSVPPEFDLPPAALASSCHYMPLFRSSIDGKTVNVFDTFAHVGHGRLHIIWRDVVLEPEERATLDTLLPKMGYLGRAESWTDAAVTDISVEPNVAIITEPSNVSSGVSTLCCLSPSEYQDWREVAVSVLRSQMEGEKRGKATKAGKGFKGLSAKDLKGIESLVPETLFDALQVDTSEMKSVGWSGPPGSRWINYHIPHDAFRTRPSNKVRAKPLPTVARYRIRSKVPLMIFDAVSLGELVHESLVRLSNGSAVFTGCDEEGRPLKEDHTMVLAHGMASQISGMRITDLTIYNGKGFAPEDESSLRSLKFLNWNRDLEAILIGIGSASMFVSEGGIIGRSTRWISVTPFVPPRCPKFTRTGTPKLDESGFHIGSAEHELRRLLSENGYPRVKSVNSVPRANVGGSSRSWLSFRRHRKSADRRPLNEAGFGFEIEFDEPIDGPLAIGYGSHFGLGLFRPVR